MAPVNSIGDGILSAASIVTSAHSGVSASKSTGSIREENIVAFLSNDCDTDKLVFSLEFSGLAGNPCDATQTCLDKIILMLVKMGILGP